MSRARTLLEMSGPFSELESSMLDRLRSEAKENTFATGDVLFHELEEGDEIFFLVEGSVRISIELASAYHLIEEIEGGPGELVGEGRFISSAPRPATVTAISQVTALVWDVNSWKQIAEDDPRTGYKLAIFAGQVLFARVGELQKCLLNDMSWGIS